MFEVGYLFCAVTKTQSNIEKIVKEFASKKEAEKYLAEHISEITNSFLTGNPALDGIIIPRILYFVREKVEKVNE